MAATEVVKVGVAVAVVGGAAYYVLNYTEIGAGLKMLLNPLGTVRDTYNKIDQFAVDLGHKAYDAVNDNVVHHITQADLDAISDQQFRDMGLDPVKDRAKFKADLNSKPPAPPPKLPTSMIDAFSQLFHM